MIRPSNQGRSVSSMFVYLLLGLFALVCTLAVLLGVGFYRSVAATAERNAEERIAGSFLRSMVASRAACGGVYVEPFEGSDVIVLPETIDGEELVTRIYCRGGMLLECFGYMEDEFDPELGEPVCSAERLEAVAGNGLLKVTVFTLDGGARSIAVAVPEGGGK